MSTVFSDFTFPLIVSIFSVGLVSAIISLFLTIFQLFRFCILINYLICFAINYSSIECLSIFYHYVNNIHIILYFIIHIFFRSTDSLIAISRSHIKLGCNKHVQ